MINLPFDVYRRVKPLFAGIFARPTTAPQARRRGPSCKRAVAPSGGGAGVVPRRLAALAAFGALAAGCAEERAQATAPPAATAPAQEAAVAAAAAASAAAASAEPAATVGGWRDLKFGMSEAEVKKLIHKYRKNSDTPWERSKDTTMPIVRFEARQLDDAAVDEKRFHHWGARELDDGAEFVHAWHDRGALVAIQLRGKAMPHAFIRKASEAYGAPPQKASFRFFDSKRKIQQSREVMFWRGADATAFVWAVASSPMLLLWSNAAMADSAAQYQVGLDAPATAASNAARVSEDGTKF